MRRMRRMKPHVRRPSIGRIQGKKAFNSKSTEVDGILFPSKLERDCWNALRTSCGNQVLRQVEITLKQGEGVGKRRGSHRRKGAKSLVVDFLSIVHVEGTRFIGEFLDAKGAEAPSWAEKVADLEKEHGLKVRLLTVPAMAFRPVYSGEGKESSTVFDPVFIRIDEGRHEPEPGDERGKRWTHNIICKLRVHRIFRSGAFEGEFFFERDEVDDVRYLSGPNWDERAAILKEKYGVSVAVL